MSHELRAGWQGVLQYKRGGIGADGDWATCEIVRDVTFGDEDDKADASNRGAGRFKVYIPGQTDLAVDIELLHDPDDDGYDAFRNAKINRTKLGVRILDQALADGGEGVEMDVHVFSFTRNEPLGEPMTVTASIAPAYSPGYAPTYLEAGATATGT